MRTVLDPPSEMVSGGKCNWGTFNGRIEHVNPLEAHKPLGFSAPRAWKNFRLKEWEAFQIMNDEWFMCLAVYNTKSIGTAILMIYNIREDRLYRYDRKVPRHSLVVASGLGDSHSYYHGKGFEIDIYNKLQSDKIEVSFRVEQTEDLPAVEARFNAVHDTEPIVIVQPFGENRPLYSHKALMSCDGSLLLGKHPVSLFSPSNGAMIIDDHKGFYPYVMKYDWCTGCGIDENGKPSGFNLTDNQVIDHEKYNENCLWLDGRMFPLPPVSFRRPEGLMKPWKIRDSEGMVEIDFIPLKDVPNIVNIGIIKMDYHGVFGSLKGSIAAADGRRISFDDFAAMGEKKFIRM